MSDPFAVLGVPREVDLAEDEIETRYLRLSRQWHPDFHPDAGGDERAEVLARSAELNRAYRALRDRWERAQAIVELADPGVMERKKELCPAFLMTAMELGEEIEETDAAGRDALVARLRRTLDDYFGKIADHVAAGRWAEAATELHEARYYRRAVQRLREARERQP